MPSLHLSYTRLYFCATMEKSHELPRCEESLGAEQHVREKRTFTFVQRAALTALVLLVSGLWFIVPDGLGTGCSRKLTVHERAERILKHTPLIG
jgi:hypothetical protein